jgi:succinoglycan biosynthesis transport protein ExoP
MHTPLRQVKPPVPTEIIGPTAPYGDRVDLLRTTAVYSEQERQIEYLVLLRRHRLAVVVIFVLCLLGGGLYTLFAPKSYQVRTVLEITGVNQDFMNTRAVDLNAGTGTQDGYLETQIDLLQNESVTDRVISAMAPQVPERFTSSGKAREAVIGRMLSTAKAKEQGGSTLVVVTLVGPDPKLAADTANELTNQYIQLGEDARIAAVSKTGVFLKQQLADAKKKLQDSEDALQDYARASGILLTDDSHESVATEHLREIQQGLAQAEVDRATRQAQAEMTRRASAEELPEVAGDPLVREDVTRLTELRRQLAELSTTMTPANYRVQKVQSQIHELEAEIAHQRSMIITQLSVQEQAAARRQDLLKRQYAQQMAVVSDQGGKQVRYNMLKHEVDVNRLVYQSMLQRQREAGVMAALRAPSARVVSPAKPPLLPYSPKLAITGPLSLLAGIVLSLFYILLYERGDNRLRSPGESGQHAECPELAVIPRARRIGKPSRTHLRLALENGTGLVEVHPMLQHWKQPDRTFMAEAYRSAVTSILFSRRGGVVPKVLLVTSPHPQCGKTTTIANLAVSLAEGRRSVLLIDGDLRRPALPQLFDIHETEGLSNALDEEEQANPISLVRPTQFPGLYILPSGGIKGSVAKLLHSDRLAMVIEIARREFDFVLVDAPPLLGLADARIISRFTDGLILVCRAGRTSVDDLNEARRLLAEDGTNILGTILNDYDVQREKSSHYHAYSTYVGTT